MNRQKTVVIGLSGGVDSAVAALLLKNKGYRVIGAFMKNFSDTKNPLTGECNWLSEYHSARKVAAHLEIPLHLFDFEHEYKTHIINKMVHDYSRDLTPNPDISCNTLIKFPLFWKEAKKLGADLIAMGHYARIKKNHSCFHLFAGTDKNKDQSYFLSEIAQFDLSHTLFPIGSLTKEHVRKIAKMNNLPNWNKRSTRGICFVGKVPLKEFLEKSLKNKTGFILNEDNEVIGNHPGSFYFTIGQRLHSSQGVKISNKYGMKKWYVAKKEKNTLLAVNEDSPLLLVKHVTLDKLHLISPKSKIPSNLKARIRHLGELHSGNLKKTPGGYLFTFKKPVKAVAPGQFLVIYSKDLCLGGGEIRASVAR